VPDASPIVPNASRRGEASRAADGEPIAEYGPGPRRAQLDTIFEQAGIGVALIHLPTLRVLRANPALAEMLGYTEAELTARTLTDMSPPEDLAAEAALAAEVVAGGRSRFQLRKRYYRKDGSTLVGRLTATVVRDAAGCPLYGVGMVEDVSERERLEAQLREREAQFRQAQKMEALGRVAGGVAHDFNNLLHVILSSCDLALAELPPGAPGRADVDAAAQAAAQAAALTRQLLAFSRQQPLQPEPVPLDAFLATAEPVLRRALPERVALELALGAPGVCVVADPGQLTQVILNLAVNAGDAMPDGGTLRVATAPRARGAGAEAAVLLTVEDTGTGMSPRVQARIFEPFFTTKATGRGTGLGLATVYGIVAQSGGHIEVESAVGVGSRFTVVLPVIDDPGSAEARATPPGRERSG
jgi:PAS domain S-box-containing protein